MKNIVLAIVALLTTAACWCKPVTAEEGKGYLEALFTLGEIATVELEMPEATWQRIVTKASDKDYHECAVTINGERFDHVAIRTKGASSLDDVKMMQSDRYSFTLKLNKYEKGQEYHGLTKLLLNNNIWDATQMKDAVVYDMCRFIGLPAPLTNYARISLNGKSFGCYLMVEPVDKHFARRNWPDEVSNIYKPYHNLAYTGANIENYAEIANYAKVKGGEASMQRVVEALKSVDEGKDIDTPFLADVSKRTFFMKLLANETYKARYYHYLSVLCNEYINGGELDKTIATIVSEIGDIAGTEANAFYTNGQFHKATQTLRLVLERRAASVLGQMNGTIPATWESQKAQPQNLIPSDDINLQELGGI